jgi:hypothetical protein
LLVGGLGFANNLNGPWDRQPSPSPACGQASNPWTVPYLVPAGFNQWMAHDETKLDVYAGVDDLRDMNTQNERRAPVRRYRYSTCEQEAGSALAVTDFKTGAAKVLVRGGPESPTRVPYQRTSTTVGGLVDAS